MHLRNIYGECKEMTKLKDNEILITDDSGKEYIMTILFSYENEETHKKYVLVYDKNNEDEVYALTYNDEGELSIIEDKKELDEISEVFEAYQTDQGEAEEIDESDAKD